MAFGSSREPEGMSDITHYTDCREALAAVMPTVEAIERELDELMRDDEGKPHE